MRQFEIARALESVRSLARTTLTEEEVHHCLELESASRRRKAIIKALIARAVFFQKRRYVNHLKEKYCAPSEIQDSGRG